MSQPLMKRRPTHGSLSGREDARTVLLRMAMDEERAARIRSLKNARPDLTWSVIADKVGVTERSAIDWQKTGGISYTNCKKLAKLFKVDHDWLWSGVEQATPDLMGALGGVDAAQLDRIEAKLDELLTQLAARELPAGFDAAAFQAGAQQAPSDAEPPRRTGSQQAS